MATAADVRDLLRETSLPEGLADALVEGAAATWLMGEPAEVLAADLALCHPPLAGNEVRAVVKGASEGRARLTVVAGDRPGLLATVAGALATHGLAVCSVRGTAWTEPALALLSVFVYSDSSALPVPWDAVGTHLRSALEGADAPPLQFRPRPPVEVSVSPQEAGRFLVTVDAPAQLESLWATATWFEIAGANIEAAAIDAVGQRFRATFLAAGSALDAAALTKALSGRAAQPQPGRVARVIARTGVAAGGLGAAIAWRVRRSARHS